jgi:hypothetical protein
MPETQPGDDGAPVPETVSASAGMQTNFPFEVGSALSVCAWDHRSRPLPEDVNPVGVMIQAPGGTSSDVDAGDGRVRPGEVAVSEQQMQNEAGWFPAQRGSLARKGYKK